MPVPESLSSLKTKPVRFKDVISKEEMESAVYGFLGIK